MWRRALVVSRWSAAAAAPAADYRSADVPPPSCTVTRAITGWREAVPDWLYRSRSLSARRLAWHAMPRGRWRDRRRESVDKRTLVVTAPLAEIRQADKPSPPCLPNWKCGWRNEFPRTGLLWRQWRAPS